MLMPRGRQVLTIFADSTDKLHLANVPVHKSFVSVLCTMIYSVPSWIRTNIQRGMTSVAQTRTQILYCHEEWYPNYSLHRFHLGR
jgi:hypothetical protein